MSDELFEFKSIEKSIKESINNFRRDQNEKRKRIAAEQMKRTEEYFFALKITQPAQVKSIFRIKPNSDLEERLVADFIKNPLADPTKFTLVMEGKPFVALVSMDNGLQYRAAMTRLMYIEWPKNSVKNPKEIMQKLLGDKNDQPTIHADSIEYALFLWPIHKNNKIDETDFIDVRWREQDEIATLREKEGKDVGDGIHTVGGIHLSGTAVCGGSFRLLNDMWGMRSKYPRHFHQLFGAIQKHYDRARQQNSLGKAIYTLFDPIKPSKGIGWTIPILPSERRIYFEIPAVKVINPNQPLRVIHKRPVPIPQRIKIDAPTQRLEYVNTHE